MFKLISPDLPDEALRASSQTSTPLMRLWNGASRSMSPIAIADYLSQYAGSVGLEPIAFHGCTPTRTAILYTYTFPIPVYQVFAQGFTNIADPRSCPSESYWLTNGQTINILKTTKADTINIDAVLAAIAVSTPIANQYQIDTSAWGTFTVPTNIFVDGIELIQSNTSASGTFAIASGAINIYVSAPLPVGAAIVHINQNVLPTPNSFVVTFALPSFAHVADLAGRSYFRAFDYLSPQVYDFVSDDTSTISLFAPLTLSAGLEVVPAAQILSGAINDITHISF
jgi:hypothetical protein